MNLLKFLFGAMESRGSAPATPSQVPPPAPPVISSQSPQGDNNTPIFQLNAEILTALKNYSWNVNLVHSTPSYKIYELTLAPNTSKKISCIISWYKGKAQPPRANFLNTQLNIDCAKEAVRVIRDAEIALEYEDGVRTLNSWRS